MDAAQFNSLLNHLLNLTTAQNQANAIPRAAIIIAKPEQFNGDSETFSAWERQMRLYLSNPTIHAQNKDLRVSTVLSFVVGPKVEGWVNQYWKDHCTANIWNITGPDILLNELKKAFGEKNAAKNAQLKIDRLYQKNTPADQFFIELESLISVAGYAKTDTYVLTLIERNVNPYIIDRIYDSGTLPADFEAWKTKIIEMDALRRQRFEDKRNTGVLPPTRGPAQASAPQKNAAPQQAQGQYRPQYQGQAQNYQRPTTSYTFSGQGQPMDTTRNQNRGADPICKKCRQAKSQKGTCGSPWHTPNQVPNQNQHVRQIDATPPTAPEGPPTPAQTQDIFAIFRQMATADPEGFARAGFGNNPQ